MKQKKAVVMGGSFNPPTIAHEQLLKAAVEAIGADYGIFAPASQPYVAKKLKKKERHWVMEDRLRLEMLHAICAGDPRLRVDESEMQADCRTFETMCLIQEKLPDVKLFFLMGMDKLYAVPRWHEIEAFVERFDFLVVQRGQPPLEKVLEGNDFLRAHRDAFHTFQAPEGLSEISSSALRSGLRAKDNSVRAWLRPEVWSILEKNGYYGLGDCIDEFREDYRFLSNFYPSVIRYQGLTYQNAEAAFQAQKCLDPEVQVQFCEMIPAKAKGIGRRVPLRADWEAVKLTVMLDVVRAKFTQNPDLAGRLLETGDKVLMEGNKWGDTFWGMDLRSRRGENHLGKILMQVRAELLEAMEK